MKKIIDGIIVVEGKTDVTFLSEFIETEFVITNGSEVSTKTIEYLKKASTNRNVYVLTDPDTPGKKIRDCLDKEIANLYHCFLNKNDCIKKGKVGVAESNKEAVLVAINNAYKQKKNIIGDLMISDLQKLGLVGCEDSNKKRNKICNLMHLGYCNAKTFLKRLNNNNISLEELKNYL